MMVLNRKNRSSPEYTSRVIQFGEGNFLRCFVDWQLDILNEHTALDAGIVVVRPINNEQSPSLNTQDGLYTTVIRGLNESSDPVEEYRIITSVNQEIWIYQEFDVFLALAHQEQMRFIVSNTTEAGIVFSEQDKYDDVPPHTYPAKLTRLLHERYRYFKGAKDKGFIILPCELIDDNGEELKKLVLAYADLWQLEASFIDWLSEANIWCSTLVDRIVTGYPQSDGELLQEKLGYKDAFMSVGEYFYLWVIKGPKQLLTEELNLETINLNVVITSDISGYKMRKVAILNGAHTALAAVAYLYGVESIGQAMQDSLIKLFIQDMLEQEIMPVLTLPIANLEDFKQAVLDRFANPYLHHKLLDIALNAMTKYKTRILPQVIAMYAQKNKPPKRLLFVLAALMRFYKGENELGVNIELREDPFFLKKYEELWQTGNYTIIVEEILALDHWQVDWSTLPGAKAMIIEFLTTIDQYGMKHALGQVV